MRFPLPQNTFPPLILSEEEELDLQKLAQEFVDDALHQYERFRNVDGGVLDKTRWKLIKTQEGVTTYQDTQMLELEAARAMPNKKVGSGIMTSTRLHTVLAVGAIEGEFNDMVFGQLNSSTELLRIKTAYTDDKCVDARVLATILQPTPRKPERGMFVKWGLCVSAPIWLRKVVRPRDFLYLESVGTIVFKQKERIGYRLVHSLQIPSIPELVDYQIVRSNISICTLFRQKSPGQLELYVKGFVDPMGDVHRSIVVPATAGALLSFSKFVHCGRMKKLNWLLKTKKSVMLGHNSNICRVCSKQTYRSNTCEVCMNTICASCSIAQKLSFVSQDSRQIFHRSLKFCARCIRTAFEADGLEIASEELTRQNPFDMYELSGIYSTSTRPASPTESIPPDTISEFFG